MKETAIIIYVHGSKDPAWSKPFISLKELVCWQNPETAVEIACLQFGAPTLEEAVGRLRAGGAKKILVAPLFLSSLGHVAKDVPVAVESVQLKFPDIKITVAPAIGEFPAVQQTMAECISKAGEGV